MRRTFFLEKLPEYIKLVSGSLLVIFNYILYPAAEGEAKPCKNV